MTDEEITERIVRVLVGRRYTGKPSVMPVDQLDNPRDWSDARALLPVVREAQAAVGEPHWHEGNPNDGRYEYVEAGDCDGTHWAYLRRTPDRFVSGGDWEKCDSIPGGALYPEQRRDRLGVHRAE